MHEHAASRIDTIANSKGWTVEAILADPRKIDLFDHRGREFLEENRSRLEPGLLQKAGSTGAEQRLQIGIMLLEMGAPGGSDLVLQSLSSPDPAIVRSALSFLRFARWQQGKGLLVPLDQPAAATALKPFLSSADPQLRQAAVAALCRLSDPGAVERLVELLTHEDPQVRIEAASHLAIYHGDSRAWPVIQSAYSTTPPHQRYHLVSCLEGFSQSENRQVRDQAADLARQELAMLLDRGDNGAANDAHNLLQALEALAPPWKAEIHETVVASNMAAWVKAFAAGQLALGGDAPTAERYVLAWLDHPELAAYAPEIVAKLAAKANTPAIIAKLRAELGTGVSGKRLESLLDALIAIGAQDAVDLDQFASQVEGWRRFDLVVRSQRVSAIAMLEYLDRAELVPAAGHDTRARFAEGWGKGDAFGTMAGLLHEGGRFHAFDCEDASTPPDYPRLVGELAALSEGEIAISKVDVSAKSETLEMKLDSNALTVLVKLQYQGDWIDVDSLLSGLNELLAAAGSSKRYYPLTASGQFALVVLARADAMTPLVSDISFPIGDPTEARRLGQEYEAQVAYRESSTRPMA